MSCKKVFFLSIEYFGYAFGRSVGASCDLQVGSSDPRLPNEESVFRLVED